MSFCIHCGTRQLSEAKFCFSCGEIQPSAGEKGGAVGTSFSKKCEILSEVWTKYRYDEMYEDFADHNDLGLPLAYLIENEFVSQSEKNSPLIEETWGLLLGWHGLAEDTGFDSLDEVMDAYQ